MITRLTAVLVLVLFCSSATLAQERPDDYAVQLPLTLSGEGPWYRLEVPMALHLAARYGDLRDLRVFNAEGQALAYALLAGQVEAHERQQEQRVKAFPLYAEAGDNPAAPRVRVERSSTGTLIELMDEADAAAKPTLLRGWLLDASAVHDPLVALQLEWATEQEGFQRFSIEASDDLQTWQPWGSGQVARLSVDGDVIEQRQVELPGHKTRYLRLLWQNPQQAPQLTTASVRSQRHDNLPAPLVWSSPLPAMRNVEGDYQWQLPLALPLERLKIEALEANSLVPVRVSAHRDTKDAWQPLAQGVFYRLPDKGVETLQDELPLPGWPVQHVRLQVDARGGGLGLEPPSIKVAVRATQLVFLQRGSPPYRVALGRSGVQSAALPLATLIPGFEPARLQQLGAAAVVEQTSGVLQQEQADARQGDWKRWGLWLILLLGVGLLALMAFSLLRRPSA